MSLIFYEYIYISDSQKYIQNFRKKTRGYPYQIIKKQSRKRHFMVTKCFSAKEFTRSLPAPMPFGRCRVISFWPDWLL